MRKLLLLHLSAALIAVWFQSRAQAQPSSADKVSDQPERRPLGVASNGALKALGGVPAGTVACRQGFAVAGDSPPICYTLSGSACSSNAGSGDDGLQVRASGNRCWIANFGGMRPSPKIWGAVGDGVNNDTAAVRAAITALAGSGIDLDIGTGLYKVGPLVVSGRLAIVGSGGGVYANSCSAGLKALTTTEATLLALEGDGDRLSGICIQMGSKVNAQTAGIGVWVAAADNVVVEKTQINFPFKGIVVGDAHDEKSQVRGHAQTNSTLLYSNIIKQPSNGGVAIEIGRLSSEASTVGTVLRDNSIPCFGATATGIAHYDSAGTLQNNPNGPYACSIGTSITPGTGANNDSQQANVMFDTDVIGDSSTKHDLYVDTLTPQGRVFLVKSVNSWVSSVANIDQSVLIQNTGGGLVGNMIFIGQTFNSSLHAAPLVDIETATLVTIEGSHFCPVHNAPPGSTALELGAGVTYMNIVNNQFSCGDGHVFVNGIQIDPSAKVLNIQGNDFGATTNAIVGTSGSYSPNNLSGLIGNNLGIDNTAPSVASARTITLPMSKRMVLTGSAAVSTMNGTWSNRELHIIPTGASSFATGGNICNALRSAANTPVIALWDSGATCWHLK